MKFDPTLYLVTDRCGATEPIFLEKLKAALEGGVTLVQLREKELSGRDYFLLAKKVKEMTDLFSVPLLIDDRVDIAMAVGAAGVHVGSSDIPVIEARRLLGPDKIVGATAKTVEAALAAQESGADYLGVGAIYPTTTKVVTVITEVDTLCEICKAVNIPVVAIGGLGAENCSVLWGSPIDGMAVVSAIMKAADPKKAAIELKKKIEEIKSAAK